MQIVNYLRARIFNSSYAALDLARGNNKHIEFADKILSVKQSNTIEKLRVAYLENKGWNEIAELKYKMNKYNSMLQQLKTISTYRFENQFIRSNSFVFKSESCI